MPLLLSAVVWFNELHMKRMTELTSCFLSFVFFRNWNHYTVNVIESSTLNGLSDLKPTIQIMREWLQGRDGEGVWKKRGAGKTMTQGRARTSSPWSRWGCTDHWGEAGWLPLCNQRTDGWVLCTPPVEAAELCQKGVLLYLLRLPATQGGTYWC